MVDPKTGRVVSQADWKRTQIRMPQEQYEAITEYAKGNELSLNSAMIDLIDRGMTTTVDSIDNNPPNVIIHHLENGIKRVVYGKLVNTFKIDYTNPDLTELRGDIEYCLEILAGTGSLKDRFMFFGKRVKVFQGSSHLNVVNDGVGDLNWLVIEDHHTDKYMEWLSLNEKPT